jgi:hypothetical protein
MMGERRPSIHRSEIIPPTGAPRAIPMGNLTVASARERPGMKGYLHSHLFGPIALNDELKQ